MNVLFPRVSELRVLERAEQAGSHPRRIWGRAMNQDTSRDAALIATVQRRAPASPFWQPTIHNKIRALFVEVIVGMAWPEVWRWCSGDWAAWDFEHDDGTRLEVKQSAAKQTWAAARIP